MFASWSCGGDPDLKDVGANKFQPKIADRGQLEFSFVWKKPIRPPQCAPLELWVCFVITHQTTDVLPKLAGLPLLEGKQSQTCEMSAVKRWALGASVPQGYWAVCRTKQDLQILQNFWNPSLNHKQKTKNLGKSISKQSSCRNTSRQWIWLPKLHWNRVGLHCPRFYSKKCLPNKHWPGFDKEKGRKSEENCVWVAKSLRNALSSSQTLRGASFQDLNGVFGGLSKPVSSIAGHFKLPWRPPGASKNPNRQNHVVENPQNAQKNQKRPKTFKSDRKILKSNQKALKSDPAKSDLKPPNSDLKKLVATKPLSSDFENPTATSPIVTAT